MPEKKDSSKLKNFRSKSLDEMITRLQSTEDPRRRYEYILWLAKSLPALPKELCTEINQVKGCISKVYVLGELYDGKISWKGYSDALITRGLLAFLIKGLDQLSPEKVVALDPNFISETGLNSSLTPSRANGFFNILLMMQKQAKSLSLIPTCSNK